ncbi:MAG: dienelactone hydrolase family protein [Nakamurella sp.]
MTTIALFHSVLGVRPGVLAAAEVFRSAGHQVRLVDQYAGRVFDDYAEADSYSSEVGFPALMQLALDAVADLAAPFAVAGFSNGGGMAEFVAASRGGAAGGVTGCLQFSGALPMAILGVAAWPAATPVQLHYAKNDPFRNDEWITGYLEDVRRSDSDIETFLDYPTGGHLFTDESLPDEYDEASASLLFSRAQEFLARVDRQ